MKKINLLFLALLLGQIGYSQPQQLRVLSNNVSGFVKASNFVFFTTNDSLMKTDGTVSGTTLVKTGLSGCHYFRESNGLIYFIKDQTELWKSDGTNAGTVLLKTFVIGSIKYISTVGTYLYFSAIETATGRELYRTDGTIAGTLLLKDIATGSGDGFGTSKSVAYNGIFYFQATNSSNGKELWRTDGTSLGTYLLKDVQPGSVSGYIAGPWVSGGKVYFTGNDGTTGNELYITDGTTSGTDIIKDVASGATSGFNGDTVLTSGGFQFFIGKVTADSAEIWKTDGTSAGTSLVKGIYVNSYYWKIDLLYANAGNVYFLISDEHNMIGYVWKTDGTASGTMQFKVLNDHWREYKYTSLFHNGKYYVVFDRGGNFNLFVSDGTCAGTFLTTFGPDNYLYGLFPLGNEVVLGDMGQMTWLGYYKTDGTPGNGSHFTPQQFHDYDGYSLVIGDKLYSLAIDGPFEYGYPIYSDDYRQLFVSDQTSTRSVRNACGVSLAGSNNFVELNSKLIFTTYNPYKPGGDITKLWIYDGDLTPCDNEPGTFTLIDSDNDSYISRIRNQMNVALDGATNINVKYIPVYNPGSIAFTLNGNPFSVENVAPYSLAGDNSGNFNSWNYVRSDTFTIVAKEYSGSNGTGTLLNTSTITFSIDVYNPSVIELVIYGLTSGSQEIHTEEGRTINLVNGEKVSVEALTYGSVGSVRINYNNGTRNVMENVAPYSLFGDANGIVNKGTLVAGVNTIQATPYTGVYGGGIEGKTRTYTFNVVYSSPRMGTIDRDTRVVKCYPNPSSGYVDISLNDEATDHGIIEIYDLKGISEIVFKGDLSELNDGPLRVNTQKLSPGVYYLKVTSETTNYTEKLIIR
ncbi:MAG: T9SS type A sorting domain-containing protein [Sporocytophaga sp.]|nr:T9SS type A sorting domain-containing protein [Sporocytophaga sp.]